MRVRVKYGYRGYRGRLAPCIYDKKNLLRVFPIWTFVMRGVVDAIGTIVIPAEVVVNKFASA